MFEVQALTAPCNVLTTRSETGSGDVTSGIAETKLARSIGAFAVSTDLIHDAGYLCTRLRTDGTKATSGGKQVRKSTDKLGIVVAFVYSRQQKMKNVLS